MNAKSIGSTIGALRKKQGMTQAALAEKLNSPQLSLEVASTNRRAIRLYENLGFTAKEERSCWYRIL